MGGELLRQGLANGNVCGAKTTIKRGVSNPCDVQKQRKTRSGKKGSPLRREKQPTNRFPTARRVDGRNVVRSLPV